MKYMRGKYNSNDFKQTDRLMCRLNFPNGSEEGFVNTPDGKDHSASVDAVRPSKKITLTSLKTGYSGVVVGGNGGSYIERFEDKEEKIIEATNADKASGTEAYFPGISILSDLGDLSTIYMGKFVMSSNDVRLKKLTLGNGHKDYYNPNWANKNGGLSESIGVSGMTYLEEFNF
jgi:hypothetical protein